MAIKLTLPQTCDIVKVKGLKNAPEMCVASTDSTTAMCRCWWFTEGNDSRGYGQWGDFPAAILEVQKNAQLRKA